MRGEAISSARGARRPRRIARCIARCIAASAVLAVGACSSVSEADSADATELGGELAESASDAAGSELAGALAAPAHDGDAAGHAADGEAGTDLPDAAESTSSTLVTVDGGLPDDFPASVPLPEQSIITMATESEVAGGRGFVVQLVTPGEPRGVFEALVARFDAEQWQELQRSTSNLGSGPTGSATYSSDELLVNLGTIGGEEPGTAAVSYSVLPAAGRATP